MAAHPGFLVWNPSHGRPGYQHHTLESAIAEARRLATVHQGERFYVMGPCGSAFIPKPQAEYETMNPLPLPEVSRPSVPAPTRDMDSPTYSDEGPTDVGDPVYSEPVRRTKRGTTW